MDIITHTRTSTCTLFCMSQIEHYKCSIVTLQNGIHVLLRVYLDNIHTLPLTYLYIPPYTVLLYIVLILVISSCLTSRYIRTYSLIYSANDNARNTPHISIRILTVV